MLFNYVFVFCPKTYRCQPTLAVILSVMIGENVERGVYTKMIEVLAFFTLDSRLGGVTGFSFEQKHFRFKCERCADLCCKLEGPALTRNDVERIANEGFSVKDFLEPVSKDGSLTFLRCNMKNRDDGSCAFLEFDDKMNCHKCGIYNFRPVLCRLYPFSFEIVSFNRIALKYIPCCRGLNNLKGEPINKKFVSTYLLEPLLETIEILQKRRSYSSFPWSASKLTL